MGSVSEMSNSYIITFRLTTYYYFTQRSDGASGPPGPAGVPGIDGIDVSLLISVQNISLHVHYLILKLTLNR